MERHLYNGSSLPRISSGCCAMYTYPADVPLIHRLLCFTNMIKFVSASKKIQRRDFWRERWHRILKNSLELPSHPCSMVRRILHNAGVISPGGIAPRSPKTSQIQRPSAKILRLQLL